MKKLLLSFIICMVPLYQSVLATQAADTMPQRSMQDKKRSPGLNVKAHLKKYWLAYAAGGTAAVTLGVLLYSQYSSGTAPALSPLAGAASSAAEVVRPQPPCIQESPPIEVGQQDESLPAVVVASSEATPPVQQARAVETAIELRGAHDNNQWMRPLLALLTARHSDVPLELSGHDYITVFGRPQSETRDFLARMINDLVGKDVIAFEEEHILDVLDKHPFSAAASDAIARYGFNACNYSYRVEDIIMPTGSPLGLRKLTKIEARVKPAYRRKKVYI